MWKGFGQSVERGGGRANGREWRKKGDQSSSQQKERRRRQSETETEERRAEGLKSQSERK